MSLKNVIGAGECEIATNIAGALAYRIEPFPLPASPARLYSVDHILCLFESTGVGGMYWCGYGYGPKYPASGGFSAARPLA